MEVGLRQRSTPTRSDSPPPFPVSTITPTTTTVQETTTRTWSRQPLVGIFFWGRRLWILFHVATIVLYIHGWISRMALHNGSECEMTYSNPHFVPIETHFVANSSSSSLSSSSSSKMSQSYKLYKFVDGRDPRYQSLLKRGTKEQPILAGSSHCIGGTAGSSSNNNNNKNNNNKTLVLYIPGHWGSYHQARSLGAHGTQWTRARENPLPGQQALANGIWSGQTNQLSHFVYEVYSLDFAEQGGAWHASFLEHQCDFLAHVLVYLTTTCHVDHIYLVAHSMGGYVARLLPLRHAHLQRLVPNMITLATPHANPLYAMDESIHQLHQSLNNHKNDGTTTMVSIGGGMRDEMIAPFACRLEKGYTYSSTTMVKSGRLGMDHRAIVWCHGLLDQVRKILWIQAQPQLTPTEQRDRIVEMLGTENYDQTLYEMKSQSLSQFGSWTTIAMESAMLYNLPILYGIYALLAGLHCAFPEHYSLAAFLLGILHLLSWTNHHHSPPWSIHLILFGVANSIHFLLTWCLIRAVSYQVANNHSWQWAWTTLFLVMGIVLPVVGLFLIGVLYNESWTLSGLASGGVYYAGVVAMILTCLWMVGQSTTTFRNKNGAVYLAALILMTIPGILAGSIALLIWEQQVDGKSWLLWARLVIPIVAMGACQKSLATRTRTTTTIPLPPPPPTTTTPIATNTTSRDYYWIRGCLLGLVMLGTTGPRVLWHGHSFRVAHLVMGVVMTDCCWHFLLALAVDSQLHHHLYRNPIPNSSKEQ